MPLSIVVVPCYNEALRLDVGRFRDYARRHADVQFLMVDDGSRDDTPSLLARLHADQPRQFVVHRLERNEGKAEAVRQGVRLALNWRPDYVGYWDADLATPLDAIGEFVHVLKRRTDVQAVIGCRMPLLGRRIERRGSRRLLSRLFVLAAARTLGIDIRDTQCGAKMFRASAQLAAAFARPFRARWVFDVEVLARLIGCTGNGGRKNAATAVYELPLDEWREVAGSKIRPRDLLRIAAELAAIHWEYAIADRWPWRTRPSLVVEESSTATARETAAEPPAQQSETPRRAA